MSALLHDSLAAAMLTDRERHVVARLVERLREEIGTDLRAIWLYGSRARGDATIDEQDVDRHSDIDLLAIADGGHERYSERSFELVCEVADAEGVSPIWYSLRVRDPEWLRGRREIRSFFIQEVDRDKLVLYGSGLE
jgi:predicted nucleotidyltransferase